MSDQDSDIPNPPKTMPASPIARDVEMVVERVMRRLVDVVHESNGEVKVALKHILDELLVVKREVEHLAIRVTAHDAQIAALVLERAHSKKAKKGARRASRSR